MREAAARVMGDREDSEGVMSPQEMEGASDEEEIDPASMEVRKGGWNMDSPGLPYSRNFEKKVRWG